HILRSLQKKAGKLGKAVGAKFTNTLVVENDPEIFPSQPDPYMYLSGPPLHVISMTLMQRFREDLGFEMPVSFSAGIDAKNFPAAVACGMVPVTTCTDLLRQGGFGRLPAYLRALGRDMEAHGVSSREAYVLVAGGNGVAAMEEALKSVPEGMAAWRDHGARLLSAAREDPDTLPAAIREVAGVAGLDPDLVTLSATRIAGRLNGRDIVDALPADERYHWARNSRPLRTVDSDLALYDCLNCDLCVSACPNDAIFVYFPDPVSHETEILPGGPGGPTETAVGSGFLIETDHQLAVYDGACNECSNCEVYCPEIGAPFREKERVFSTKAHFSASEADGFFRDGQRLLARIGRQEHEMEIDAEENVARLSRAGRVLELRWESLAVLGWGPVKTEAEPVPPPEGVEKDGAFSLDTAVLWRMKTVWESIYESNRPNPVNPKGP
ncbi:MAG: 4Fe-4S binding protein, partial [Gemmatimonadetes bacterium]|nr:4Fe-4S binding protein [Gemmatimonadota bacterium]